MVFASRDEFRDNNGGDDDNESDSPSDLDLNQHEGESRSLITSLIEC